MNEEHQDDELDEVESVAEQQPDGQERDDAPQKMAMTSKLQQPLPKPFPFQLWQVAVQATPITWPMRS